ncbi:GNAT family N-acetyltransferase [Aliiroseovarius sp. KMU-50]|uniref:GNAT family N-acetyltransferase n=1 Tax=Aliiroseovarius salicola TaxID=3009082 RepID=A0ABT4W6D9_9RHOB|nr:GNAT family N-acetyltransferase [Aliiroseovarius sp. KMU-50]MDA5095432.1 GNAT family N-acetyltransferase [Aliiroseovarius sp. KMU-50]
MTPRLASAEDANWIIALIRRVFAEHDGRIDPPSSMHRMTVADVQAQMTDGEIWVIGQEACLFLTPQEEALYLSKLTVAPEARGKGYARLLVRQADCHAQALGKPRLRLQTRVELTDNHAIFRAFGFEQVGSTRHSGFDRTTSLTFERPVKS